MKLPYTKTTALSVEGNAQEYGCISDKRTQSMVREGGGRNDSESRAKEGTQEPEAGDQRQVRQQLDARGSDESHLTREPSVHERVRRPFDALLMH